MLTAHECLRSLQEIRGARPLVSCGWRGPDTIRIETDTLAVLLHLAGHGRFWVGWASSRGRDLDAIDWPPSLMGRLYDEIDEALTRAGVSGALDRETFNELPF